MKKFWFKRKIFFFLLFNCSLSFHLFTVPPLALISVPKGGTWLLYKTLNTISAQPYKISNFYNILCKDEILLAANQILITHLFGVLQNIELLKSKSLKKIFIYRDPRDQLVSLVHFIFKYPDRFSQFQRYSFDELLTELIVGGGKIWERFFDMDLLTQESKFIEGKRALENLTGIASFYALYLEWLKETDIFTTSFEKLVGVKGGGDDEIQKLEIKNIASFIGIALSEVQIERIKAKVFSGTGTFREGKIGSWKKHFNEQHKTLFKENAGQLLIDLGYEKDFSW